MAKKKAAAAKPAAKKVNKSQIIRDHLEKHPDAKPKDAAAQLSIDHGITVKPTDVSQVKTKLGKTNGKPKGKKKKAVATPTQGGTMEERFDAAFELLSVCGMDHEEAVMFLRATNKAVILGQGTHA